MGIFTSIISISLDTSEEDIQKELARQNAKLALKIAIGELQKTTGRDTAVKLPLDIRNKSLAFNSVNKNNFTQIHFSISGENEKIPVYRRNFLNKDLPKLAEKYKTNPPLIPVHFGLQQIDSSWNWDSAILQNKLSKAISWKHLHLVRNVTAQEFQNTFDPTEFCFENFGVIASSNPNCPGLRKDLSQYPDSLITDYPIMGQGIINYLNAYKDTNEVNHSTHTPPILPIVSNPNLNLGAAYPVNAPIITNLMIAFTIRSHSPVADHPNFYARTRFFTELWNPYTHEIDFMPEQGGHFILKISGLPTVKVTNIATGEVSNPVNLQRVFGPNNQPEPMEIILNPDLTDSTQRLLPGKTLNWVGIDAPSTIPIDQWPSKSMTSKLWQNNDFAAGGSIGIDTGVERIPGNIRISSDQPSPIKIQLYHQIPNNPPTLISNLGPFTYEPFSTNPNGLFSTHQGISFGYHIQLKGPHHSQIDEKYRGLWLAENDPRNPNPKTGVEWYLNSPYISVNNGSVPIFPYPDEINQSIDSIKSIVHDRMFDRSYEDGINLNALHQNAPVFEFPMRPYLSIAELQHVYLQDIRPFSIGNSWGNATELKLLDWFDRYYFSAINAEYSDFKHPSYYKLRIPNSNHASSHMIDGAFNINSTSATAWEALLASNNKIGINYLNSDHSTGIPLGASSETELENAFSRYTHTSHLTYESPSLPMIIGNPPERVAQTQYHRKGVMELSKEDIQTIAKTITDLIKIRNDPFQSLSEFLEPIPGSEKSILETALDSWQQNTGIDMHSASYLSQADIMASLGSHLICRNDTFKIIATGQIKNTNTEKEISEAKCEAIIQRIPTEIPALNQGDDKNRKYQIISFRWLTSN